MHERYVVPSQKATNQQPKPVAPNQPIETTQHQAPKPNQPPDPQKVAKNILHLSGADKPKRRRNRRRKNQQQQPQTPQTGQKPIEDETIIRLR